MKDTIVALRKRMQEKGVDAWMVNSSDFHDSEYVGEHFRTRAFLSGFTGSAGTLLVTATDAGLWTDGRYFVQAAAELKDSGITLYKSGLKGVPTIMEYLKENMPENGCLGFDGRTVGQQEYLSYAKELSSKNARFSLFDDLGGDVWTDRPAINCTRAWVLDEAKYAGQTVAGKLEAVRGKMEEAGADVHLLTSLDDIAWLLNIRGSDVAHNPVILSYVAVTMDQAYWFVNEASLNEEVLAHLAAYNVVVKAYDEIGAFAGAIAEGSRVLLQENRVSCAVYGRIPQGVKIVDAMNPETLLKACKNETEQENIRKAHIKDGVAMVRFMYWLDQNLGKEKLTELSCARKLDGFRREQEGYVDLSFGTISAYGANAAMCHYSPSEESDAVVEPKGLLLVDSGGHYLEGSTDITRTMAMGPLTEDEIHYYTLVLKAHIQLAMLKFPYGSNGCNLDTVCRACMWAEGVDFNHGTGHGVGYLLNVHEGPNRIHWHPAKGAAVMEEGMLTSNEPGYYMEGAFGIRTENLTLVQKWKDGELGQLLELETVTLAPIDTEPVDLSMMTEEEIDWLNAYHQDTYEKLAPGLNAEERAWLADACAPLVLA